jgi:hypothetical protein
MGVEVGRGVFEDCLGGVVVGGMAAVTLGAVVVAASSEGAQPTSMSRHKDNKILRFTTPRFL